MKRLWGKRFKKVPAALAEIFTSGRDVRGTLPADERLIPYDLWGSRAHVLMLARQKILPKREARALIKGLKAIEASWKKGEFHLDPSQEDVHSNIESILIKKFGSRGETPYGPQSQRPGGFGHAPLSSGLRSGLC
jgi:argininosuccinate lyase